MSDFLGQVATPRSMGELSGAASAAQALRPLGCAGALLPFELLAAQLGGEAASRGLLLPAPAASRALPLLRCPTWVGAPQGAMGGCPKRSALSTQTPSFLSQEAESETAGPLGALAALLEPGCGWVRGGHTRRPREGRQTLSSRGPNQPIDRQKELDWRRGAWGAAFYPVLLSSCIPAFFQALGWCWASSAE